MSDSGSDMSIDSASSEMSFVSHQNPFHPELISSHSPERLARKPGSRRELGSVGVPSKGFYRLLIRRQDYFTSLAKITTPLASGLCDELVKTLEVVLGEVDILEHNIELWYIVLREEEVYG